jgi:hypothetical protein
MRGHVLRWVRPVRRCPASRFRLLLTLHGRRCLPACLMWERVCAGRLRLGRAIYDPIMPALPGPDYDNLRYDAQLSIAVGGATGCFVGTDMSYGDANWMGPLLGVTDDDVSHLAGCWLLLAAAACLPACLPTCTGVARPGCRGRLGSSLGDGTCLTLAGMCYVGDLDGDGEGWLLYGDRIHGRPARAERGSAPWEVLARLELQHDPVPVLCATDTTFMY